MSLGHSPAIVTNGLVFYYDMSNTAKSFIGAVTTNLITNSLPDGTATGYTPTGGTVAYHASTASTVWTCPVAGFAGWGAYMNIAPSFTGTLSTTNSYTISFEWSAVNASTVPLSVYNYGLVQGDGTLAAISQVSLFTNSTLIRDNWYLFKYTATPANTGTGLAYNRVSLGAQPATSTFYIRKVQFEQLGVASTYVTGSRSNTQALKDLTNNSAPQVVSLTYPTSTTFSFNGTSSYIIAPENAALNTNTPTVEVWIKTAALSQNGFFFEKGQFNTSYSLFQEGGNIVWRTMIPGQDNLYATTASYITASNWAHIVGTYESGSKRIYINGVQVSSSTSTGTVSTNTNGISIGVYGGYNGGHSYYYNGSIGSVKVYNRVLSAAEVLQNFNAHKGRYGL